jgi:hypothetical protein
MDVLNFGINLPESVKITIVGNDFDLILYNLVDIHLQLISSSD